MQLAACYQIAKVSRVKPLESWMLEFRPIFCATLGLICGVHVSGGESDEHADQFRPMFCATLD